MDKRGGPGLEPDPTRDYGSRPHKSGPLLPRQWWTFSTWVGPMQSEDQLIVSISAVFGKYGLATNISTQIAHALLRQGPPSPPLAQVFREEKGAFPSSAGQTPQ